MDSNAFETTKLVKQEKQVQLRNVTKVINDAGERKSEEMSRLSFEKGFKTVRYGVEKLAHKLDGTRAHMIRLGSDPNDSIPSDDDGHIAQSGSKTIQSKSRSKAKRNTHQHTIETGSSDETCVEELQHQREPLVWGQDLVDEAASSSTTNANNNNNNNQSVPRNTFQHGSVLGIPFTPKRYSSTPTTFNQNLQSRIDRGIRYFNLNPKKGLKYVQTSGVLGMWAQSSNPQGTMPLEYDIPKAIARFLRKTRGLNKEQIGVILGEDDAQSKLVLREYLNLCDFTCYSSSVRGVESALRKLLAYFRPPGEAQKIDRILSAFSEKFARDCDNSIVNPALSPSEPHQDDAEDESLLKVKVNKIGETRTSRSKSRSESDASYRESTEDVKESDLLSAEVVYMLAFITILLNVDLHNKNNPRRMTRKQFLRNCSNVDELNGISQSELKQLYDRVAKCEIKHIVDREDRSGNLFTNPDKCGWLMKKGPNAWSRWKYRWFILSANTLYYFRNRDDLDFLGFIPLENVQVHSEYVAKVNESTPNGLFDDRKSSVSTSTRSSRIGSVCSEYSTMAESTSQPEFGDEEQVQERVSSELLVADSEHQQVAHDASEHQQVSYDKPQTTQVAPQQHRRLGVVSDVRTRGCSITSEQSCQMSTSSPCSTQSEPIDCPFGFTEEAAASIPPSHKPRNASHSRSKSSVPFTALSPKFHKGLERRFSRSYSFSLLRHLQASFKGDGSGRGTTFPGMISMESGATTTDTAHQAMHHHNHSRNDQMFESVHHSVSRDTHGSMDPSELFNSKAPRNGCFPFWNRNQYWFELKPWDGRLKVKSARTSKQGELVLGQHKTMKLRVHSSDELASWVDILHHKGMLDSQTNLNHAARMQAGSSYKTRYSISGIPVSIERKQLAEAAATAQAAQQREVLQTRRNEENNNPSSLDAEQVQVVEDLSEICGDSWPSQYHDIECSEQNETGVVACV